MSKDNKRPELSQSEASERILIRQMKEEARRETIQAFLLKYRKQIIYAIVLIALIVVIIGFFNIRTQLNQEKYSKIMHQILIHENNEEYSESEKLLRKIKNSNSAPDHIKALSLLKYGSKLVKNNKISDAVESYLEAYEIKGADPYIRELAALFAVKSMIDSGDKKFIKKIKEILPDLEKDSEILKPLFTEQKGLFEWYIGNKEEANKIFKDLALNSDAPDYVRSRATQFSKITKN